MRLKTTFYKHIFLLFALLVLLAKVNAQYASQDELKKAAETFFAEEEYVKALPLYSQLLSLYPKDPDYNYKYGACYFFGNRDKEASLKYLNFATSKPNVNPQAFYFLALAQHHEYQFAVAEMNYNKFREKGNPKDVEYFQVNRKIEMCRNGVTLLRSITDIGVLQKKEIRATEFFRSYDLRGIGGKVVVKPDEFKTKYDIKKKESSIIHIGDNPQMVVFSSFGNDGKNGKDIFKVTKMPNGEWSSPAIFPDINTKHDEDYPFLHPDGKTLYFSSKGYNSMGGYDIFKSTFNASTGKWSTPENLDFPINTPDDDILFISDIDNELAYFASSRASKQGELTVYKVKVDRQPSENSLVKGFFIAESNPNMKSATISIVDVEKDKKYGVYNTNRETGEYLLVFPGNGGKFKILVETTNSAPVHSAIIELPQLKGFRALKQELRLVGEGSNEKLVVKNLFNESDDFDINDPLIVENLLKQKAKMDVNITEEDALNNSSQSTPNSSIANLTNEELKTVAKKNATTIADNAKLSVAQANYSYDLAAQKSAEAKQLLNQAEQKKKIASESQNTGEKLAAFSQSEQLKLDAAKLVNEAVAALNVAKTLESEAVERESDVKKSAELSAAISTNIAAGKRPDAEKAYTQLDEISNSTYHKESALVKEREILDNKIEEKEVEYSKARNNAIAITNRETELVEQIDVLKEKINKTSKKAGKEAYQAEINSLTVDLEDTKYDLGVAKDNEIRLTKELNDLKNSVNTSSKVIAVIEKSTTSSVSKTTDKTALNYDIAYFEKQGLVGLYPSDSKESTTSKTSASFDLAQHKDEYSIISDEGKIIDYNTKHSSRLVDAQQNASEMAKINNEWIADINEEIEIRQKQLAVADNLNEKTKLTSRIDVLKNLKSEKQKDAEKNTLLAQQQNTSSVNTSTKSTTSASSSSSVSNVNITDANGNIINYASSYEKELAKLEDKESTPATIKEKITVYENWKNANEQELLLKKIELNDAQDEDKIAIQNRIEELTDQIKDNEEYIALYSDKLPELENNELAENKTSNSQTSTSTSNNANSKTSSETKINIILPNGEVADYSTDYSNQFTKADNIVDPLTSSREKEKVTQNWIGAVEEELEFRNNELTNADASKKAEISRRIAELKSEKSSLVEQLSEIQLIRNQQETLLAASNKSIPETNNVASTTNTNSTTSSSVVSSTTNNVADNSSSKVADVGYNYTSEQAKKEIAQVKTLKEEANQLNAQANEKSIKAASLKNETQKQQLLTEASTLRTQAETKEQEIERVVEKSNKAEFYNNQAILSKAKQGVNSSDNNAIMAEMNEEESNTYFDKALAERENAQEASSNSSKQSSLAKAQEFEFIAIEKQRKAIELYNIAPKENAVVASSQQTTSSSNTIQSTSKSQSNTNTNDTSSNLDIEGLTDEEKQVIARLTPQEIAVIKSSSEYIEYASAKEESRRLVKEAQVDYVQAANYKEDANDQRILDGSLNKMTEATADATAKAKLLNQIQKLATMITETETKASELTTQAAEKENKANAMDKKADVVLASSNKAEEIKAIEKAENTNKDYLANAVASNQTPNNTKQTTNVVENNTPSNNVSNNTSTTNTIENTEANNISATKNISNQNNVVPVNNKVEDEIDYSVTEETAENVTTSNTKTTQSSSQIKEDSSLQESLNNQLNNVENEEVSPSSNTTVKNNNSGSNSNNNVTETTNVTNTSNNTVVATQPKSTNKQTPANNQQKSSATNPVVLSKIDEVPDVLTDQIFVLTPNQAAYNADKKIPTASKLPEGLVFKVQIGAFRNPIPQDHFRGFAPIMAEDAGNGITRYTAGLFNTFNMANEAKNAIRTIGYPDAFVVAFYNGKRININEARAMAGGADFASNETNATSNQNTSAANQENTYNTTSAKLPEPKANAELVEDGISTDVNKIKGVFFTVQVGVYSKPITAEQLNNVSPLNSERTANGLIRYTSGVYPNLTDANAARDRIKTLGITDAFVIAYANGNRVSVNEAVNFIASDNSAAATPKTSNQNTTPTPQPTNNNSAQPKTNNVVESETTNTTPSNNIENTTTQPQPVVVEPKAPIDQKQIGEELNLEFKVLLGEYAEEVPVDEAAVYLRIYSKGVKIKEENNKTIYTIGSYTDYSSALNMQIEMKTEGVKKPKVIAFRNGSPIEVNEALELVKNNSK